jgi:hypothetical protein
MAELLDSLMVAKLAVLMAVLMDKKLVEMLVDL